MAELEEQRGPLHHREAAEEVDLYQHQKELVV